MTVLTIYNHGTGGASSLGLETPEIVNIFGNTARESGREFIDWMVTEGVGALGGPDKSILVNRTSVDKNAAGATIGRLDLVRRAATPSAVRLRDNLALVGVGSKTAKLLSEDQKLQISGVGVDENIINVLNTLKFLERANTLPSKINMMGWSRGAVTCIRIAHFLNLDPRLKTIPVNIFAVDPVAGAGHDDETDARTVGQNVKNYVATLSVHENRNGFTAMDIHQMTFTSHETKRCWLLMPGLHANTAEFNQSSGRLTFHLCYKFLTANGTVLSDKLRSVFNLSAGNQLAEYDKLLQGNKISGITESHKGFTANLLGMKRREIHAFFAPHAHVFINAHHKELFRQIYPTVFRKFFTGSAASKDNRWENDARQSMFEEMKFMGAGHKSRLDVLRGMGLAPSAWFLEDMYGQCVINNGLL